MFYDVVNSPNELFCICDCLLTVMRRDERDVHLCNRNWTSHSHSHVITTVWCDNFLKFIFCVLSSYFCLLIYPWPIYKRSFLTNILKLSFFIVNKTCAGRYFKFWTVPTFGQLNTFVKNLVSLLWWDSHSYLLFNYRSQTFCIIFSRVNWISLFEWYTSAGNIWNFWTGGNRFWSRIRVRSLNVDNKSQLLLRSELNFSI
jgi:hypothetical protein